jgi:predicted ribonuclease toxin of YeeF-YezG toxin-antitoxin module
MELAHKDLIMDKLMLAVIKKIDRMGRVNIIGQTVIIIKGLFLTAYDTVKAISKKIRRLYNIEVNIKMIKNVVMDKLTTRVD